MVKRRGEARVEEGPTRPWHLRGAACLRHGRPGRLGARGAASRTGHADRQAGDARGDAEGCVPGAQPKPPRVVPDYTAGQAAETALSPDGRTLLISTSACNRVVGPDGKQVPALSNEHVS